ncbi:hypothetical protein BC351_15405 [Paenibacillus ferrarius]|uniref:Uncharacterized protein n=1 Tax=Paenibacillus ferrarius TaxID=1469647 RepID=A0A1V4HRN4_9BACL|nr:hypothetical protein [Paenibacillus ferrarius]OPH61321.1 hypothetical protein BC351_15405 [Paenibacillus ferrarius]
MHLIIFNIYNQYYFHEISLQKLFYVQSMYHKKDLIENEFLVEMEKAILRANGDNIYTSIQSSGNIHFVDISLINRTIARYNENVTSYYEPNPKFLYLLENWLDANLVKAKHNDMNDLFNTKKTLEEGYFVRIKVPESPNFSYPIIMDFQDSEIDYSIVYTNRFTYNAGAGSIGEGILIWIAKKFGDLAFDKLKKHLMRDGISKVDSLGIDKIIGYLEHNYQVSRLHLRMKDTNTLDNGDVQVVFATFYQDFSVIYDKKFEIKSVKTTERTQTRI